MNRVKQYLLNRKKNKMKKLFLRLTGETPTFFKKIQIIGGAMVLTALAIAGSPISLPALIVTAGTYIGFVGGTAVTVSQFVLKDATILEAKSE